MALFPSNGTVTMPYLLAGRAAKGTVHLLIVSLLSIIIFELVKPDLLVHKETACHVSAMRKSLNKYPGRVKAWFGHPSFLLRPFPVTPHWVSLPKLARKVCANRLINASSSFIPLAFYITAQEEQGFFSTTFHQPQTSILTNIKQMKSHATTRYKNVPCRSCIMLRYTVFLSLGWQATTTKLWLQTWEHHVTSKYIIYLKNKRTVLEPFPLRKTALTCSQNQAVECISLNQKSMALPPSLVRRPSFWCTIVCLS